jgi:hypothetical protein
VHTTGVPLVQTPFWHVSDWVQRFPSLQADPFGLGGLEQIPLRQVPAS